MSVHPTLVEAVRIGRRGNAGNWLFREVSLAIKANTCLGVVGPTGGGKSLILRALAKLDPLDDGEIHWRGQVVQASGTCLYRSRVVYLHQRPTLVEGSVEDNLREPFRFTVHRNKHFDHSKVCTLLEQLGRDESFLNKRLHELSGGESQLVALVRAMQLDPSVLLLDEPTAALDAMSSLQLEVATARWCHESAGQRAMVWVTHDLQQARRITDGVIEVTAGRVNQVEPG